MYKLTLFIFFISGIFLFLLGQFGCNPQAEEKEMTKEEMIKRGKFLVHVGGCQDCHTPKIFTANGPELDTSKVLSGSPEGMPMAEIDPALLQPGKWVLFTQDVTAAAGLWGISFAANLTPDNETGIGTWQEEMFINAMRTGKHLGAGRPIMPPMPWQGIGKLPDEDLKSIFAYLKSLKPIKNKVPDYKPYEDLLAKK